MYKHFHLLGFQKLQCVVCWVGWGTVVMQHEPPNLSEIKTWCRQTVAYHLAVTVFCCSSLIVVLQHTLFSLLPAFFFAIGISSPLWIPTRLSWWVAKMYVGFVGCYDFRHDLVPLSVQHFSVSQLIPTLPCFYSLVNMWCTQREQLSSLEVYYVKCKMLAPIQRAFSISL